MTLGELVRARRVLVCLGGGGVGKTTVAAALGLAAARAGRRALVLTIDPARRLADALGLALGGEPRPVEPGLDAMMLDPRPAWDRLVARHAPTPAMAARLLGNRFYRRLSQSFAGTHEYLAVEAVCALVEAGGHDLLVVDTPPATQAFAFLDAPARIRGLLDGPLARWLLAPRPRGPRARWVLRRLEDAAGAGALAEVAEFFAALAAFFDAFVARAAAVEALLHDPGTAIVVVAAPDEHGAADAEAIAAGAAALGLSPAALIVNRVHPPVDGEPEPGTVPAWILDNLRAHRRLAAAQARRVERLRACAPVVATAGDLADNLRDLDGLARLAGALAG
jgi:anion-transporting  ArsA/GET3 family ATPase